MIVEVCAVDGVMFTFMIILSHGGVRQFRVHH